MVRSARSVRWCSLSVVVGTLSLMTACASPSVGGARPTLPSAGTSSVASAAATASTPHLGGGSRTIAAPPVDATVDYQLGGSYTPRRGVTVVDRDETSVPARGMYSICYVNAFQTQDGDASFWLTRHADLLVHDHGRPVRDPDWPEYLLDTSSAAHRAALLRIVGPWIDSCAAKGFRAVEPDNLDSYTRSKGHLSAVANVEFAKLLIARAHRDGLAIAQKNTVELAAVGRRAGFDFAVAEECQAYAECGRYIASYGRRVIEIEYSDNPRVLFTRACAARGYAISVLLRDRDVVPAGRAGYEYRSC